MKRLWQSLLALFVTAAPATTASDGPLSPNQQLLLAKAENTVKNYINAEKPYPLFAIAMHNNGEVESLLASDEFNDKKQALVALLGELLRRAKAKEIKANVLVVPMDPIPGFEQKPAAFDIEERGGKRILVLIPYQKKGDAWVFGKKEYREVPPKLFAP